MPSWGLVGGKARLQIYGGLIHPTQITLPKQPVMLSFPSFCFFFFPSLSKQVPRTSCGGWCWEHSGYLKKEDGEKKETAGEVYDWQKAGRMEEVIPPLPLHAL